MKPGRNDDFLSRYAHLERRDRLRRKGPDDWVDLAQWLDEGYLVDIGAGFQRAQIRRVGDWVEMRGYVEWDGNSNNPDESIQFYEYAATLVTTAGGYSHGPLPEEFRPPGLSSISVIVDGSNSHAPAGFAATQTQALLMTSSGEMLWRPIDAWSTVSPNFGFYQPLTVYCFDNTRYYVGDDNIETPATGYVQHWPNP